MMMPSSAGAGAGACSSSSRASLMWQRLGIKNPFGVRKLILDLESPPSSSLHHLNISLRGCRSSSIHHGWFGFGIANGSPVVPVPVAGAFRRRKMASSSSSSSWNRNRDLLPTDDALVRATTTAQSDSDGEDICDSKTPPFSLLILGALFAFWYLFNIYFNIFNKQVLEVYPFPLTISAFQFAVGTLLILVMWTTNLYKRPNISSSQLLAILPLAIVHTLGNLFTNTSLGMVAVSFTHTIKAMEPFFTVLLSALFLGEFPTIWVLSSLVPIVGGVALASLTEASFNWPGLWSAMASNLTYQSRNVLSKKIMVNNEESLDNITLFSIITIMSFFLSVPLALFVEGINFTPSYIQSAGLNLREIYTRSLLAALCFHAYQQVAYMILARVSPVSHSIGNCVKRVVVIVSSVLFFRTPVSPINSLGTGVALAGVFLYSRVKKIKAKAS